MQTKAPEHERGVIDEGSFLQGRRWPWPSWACRGKQGRDCSWPGEYVGRFWQRVLATKLRFLSFLTTLLKNDLMGLEKNPGEEN